MLDDYSFLRHFGEHFPVIFIWLASVLQTISEIMLNFSTLFCDLNGVEIVGSLHTSHLLRASWA